MNSSALKSPVTGDPVNNAAGKAEILNSQFRLIFTEEPPLTDLHNTPNLYPGIEDIHFTEPGVRNLLEKLDPRKACGLNMLQAWVLKVLATFIAPMLTEIFNRSYRSGKVPSNWHHTNVSPDFKKRQEDTSSQLMLKKLYVHLLQTVWTCHDQTHHGPCCSA